MHGISSVQLLLWQLTDVGGVGSGGSDGVGTSRGGDFDGASGWKGISVGGGDGIGSLIGGISLGPGPGISLADLCSLSFIVLPVWMDAGYSVAMTQSKHNATAVPKRHVP